MNLENHIPISDLCDHYQVEQSFFMQIHDCDLIHLETIEKVQYIDIEKINDVEKMVRLYHELQVHEENIDIVFNLIQKIESLQDELKAAQRRLKHFHDIDIELA